MVVLVLIALTVAIATKEHLADFTGGAGRAIQLCIVLLGTGASLVALWRNKAAALRLGSGGPITWIGVLTLGAQPEVWRLSDDPLSPAFWQSHYWAVLPLQV